MLSAVASYVFFPRTLSNIVKTLAQVDQKCILQPLLCLKRRSVVWSSGRVDGTGNQIAGSEPKRWAWQLQRATAVELSS